MPEAFSVIWEEVEEAKEEMQRVIRKANDVWLANRRDDEKAFTMCASKQQRQLHCWLAKLCRLRQCALRRREEVQHGRKARLAERADNLPGLQRCDETLHYD